MTREELKRFRKLSFTIRFWERELERLEKSSYVKGPSGGVRGSDLSDPTSQRALRSAQISIRIRELKKRWEDESIRIMAWIQAIDDPLVQAVFYCRYVKGMSWTAAAMQIGGNNTPDGIRMMHDRYLFGLFGKKV